MGLIILITSWLTINIAPFTLGQMNIIIDHGKNSHQQRHFNFGSQIPCH
jgi:hypothetical protein